jgi:RNA polymerase sigma-70 factor, ECF subfamily
MHEFPALQNVLPFLQKITRIYRSAGGQSRGGYSATLYCGRRAVPLPWNRHQKRWMLMSDFARLLEAQIPRLRRYARALTRDAARADDLVQSCLLRAVAKQHLWQVGTDLRAWLFTILHNQHVNDVRRAMREGVSATIEDVAPILTVQSNATAVLQLRDLERAIAKLPEEQRSVILLVGLEGMRYEEVAAVLDIPVGTVRSRLSRGREALRRLMGMKEDDVAVDSSAGQEAEVSRAA